MVSVKPICTLFQKSETVLILVLLEDGFCYFFEYSIINKETCLNPCSIGRWFLLGKFQEAANKQFTVLILVLLEDGFCLHSQVTQGLKKHRS